MELLFILVALALFLVGVGGILGISQMPALKDAWPYNGWWFLGNLPDTRRNRVVLSTWLMGASVYMVLSDRLQGTSKNIAFGGFVLLALFYILFRQEDQERS